jgi:hypothetical protein
MQNRAADKRSKKSVFGLCEAQKIGGGSDENSRRYEQGRQQNAGDALRRGVHCSLPKSRSAFLLDLYPTRAAEVCCFGENSLFN